MPPAPTYEELQRKIAELEADLTGANQMLQELRDSERRFFEIIDFLPDAMFAIDTEGRVIAWNQAIEALTGIKAEQILGKGNYEYAIPFYGYRRPVLIDLVLNWDDETQNSYVYVKRRGDVLISETSNPPLKKEPSNFWNSARPLHDASGHIVGAIEVIRDITEIKQAHEDLKTRKELLQIFVAHTPAPTAMCDRNMCYLALSRRWMTAYGLTENNLIGRCHYDVFSNIPDRWKREHQRVLAGESIKVAAEIFRPVNGREEWIKRELVPWRDARGNIGGLIIFNEVVTEQKRTTEALSAEKERLAVTLHSIGDAVITTDRQGTVTLMNPVAESLTGWPEAEAVGQPLQKVFHIVDEINRRPCDNPVDQVMDQGVVVGLANDTVLISRDGSEYIIADSGAPIRDAAERIIGVVLVFRDATRERRIENEMSKIEKLESLGVLAGGIAHDFNNFLTGIIGNISLAKLDLEPHTKLAGQMNEMEKAAMRAQELTQQLLTFSKGGEPIRQPMNVARLVRESTQFALHGTNVRGEFGFAADPLAAAIDEGQITQVIHNLVLNAVQAMPEGGVVHVFGELVELDSGNVVSLPPGSYIRLRFSDQGTGIKNEHLKKVFDPYFSTKQKGSGLGLAVVYAVIDKHHGRIAVDSELGKGTTFTIFLPAATKTAIRADGRRTPVTSGSGRILVMDDEDFIRRLAVQMLEKIGYAADAVGDGAEAVARYRQALEAGQAYDAVVLDLTVPGGMGGRETVKQLLKIDPTVKAIVSSGYSNDPVMANFVAHGFKAAIKKPYLIQQLSGSLTAVLEKGDR